MPYPAEQPAAPHDETLFDARAFDAALRRGADPRRTFRRALAHGHEVLWREFRTDAPATELVHGRTRLVDQLIVRAWHRSVGPGATPIALVAVGGYGRGELLPRSDIDLMILLDEAGRERYREDVTTFITFLWDIGLEVGHSARTVADCVDEATRDITVATNLMEARILAGAPDLFESMRAAVGPERIWPSREFFAAKWQEQQARHHHFDDTAYNLEPNIKEGPGGLRDIQMVGWVAKRHFGATTLHDLVQHRFLTEREYHSLIEGQEFLWRIRFALHTLTDRREDRLLFDHQRTLADLFDYSDAEHALAVEQFMQRYYRTITELNRLNEMLLQLFQEAILLVDAPGEPEPINKRFQARRGFIEAASEDVFRRHPFALLEIFLHLMQRPSLKGVRATTIRLIRDHCHLIDEDFRRDLRARTLFVEILRQPGDLSAELGRMNRYGVLAAYLPVFGRVVGQMQYDLFHVYTVDEHTLTVVRNVGRFVGPESTREFPLAHEIYQRLPKPELLYLAAMFHDIAKGRGGDHSELGAQEAEVFCREHGLSRADTGLVTWLVFNHLLLSMTAQRRDVSDPEVVAAFARQVGDQRRLDYLYLLTMADIRGTNPKLWNSWRAALLLELYTETKRALRAGLEHVREEAELIRETKEQAAQRLAADGISAEAIVPLWQDFPDEYFLRHRPDEVAWHTA
ncbi:MAG: [protein-PII] uridylyltransferase, partial [Gammaproteobacteria bacterium]|nr:[protein-PII] uridylyltransferase [Gammaproteobacteria bacterium]